MIKVLIVDDQISVRQGLQLRFTLETDLCVVGEAEDGEMAVQLAQLLHPDVVLMDVDMPKMDGITATSQLHKILPEIGVIILSIYGDAETRTRAKEAGAMAFVEKKGEDNSLLDAIRDAVGSSQQSGS